MLQLAMGRKWELMVNGLIRVVWWMEGGDQLERLPVNDSDSDSADSESDSAESESLRLSESPRVRRADSADSSAPPLPLCDCQ